MNRITGHSLDRYKKARAIVSEGATVVAACKKARISVGQFYTIRNKLKQQRRRANGQPVEIPYITRPITIDLPTLVSKLETRRDEAATAIKVLKSL